MAFLDNSGDIILDAVLTDLGRERMAAGNGSFRIVKFGLGDDEINYGTYDLSHPSGSAYYDLEIMQTPIFEATTAINSNIKRSNLKEIHDAKIQLREKMKTLSNFEDELWSQDNTVNALYLHRCSESIRRLCAYASDMAEILLNICLLYTSDAADE